MLHMFGLKNFKVGVILKLRRLNMKDEKNSSFVTAKKEIVITRIFDASKELVWKTWTDPERLKLWWGPKDFTGPFAKIDLRVGGILLLCMRGPDGRDYWSTGIFREIVSLERIVCSDSFADEKGNVVPSSHYGMSDFPLETEWTLTFEDYQGKTRFTIKHSGIPPGNMYEMTRVGWNQSLDKFTEVLKIK